MWPAGEYKMEFVGTVGYKILIFNGRVGGILSQAKK